MEYKKREWSDIQMELQQKLEQITNNLIEKMGNLTTLKGNSQVKKEKSQPIDVPKQ